MQTLLALARHNRHKGKRSLWGATMGLHALAPRSWPHLCFAKHPSQRRGESSVHIRSVAYFDRDWAMNLSSGTRHQIYRARKKGLRFDLRISGASYPLEQMLWIY